MPILTKIHIISPLFLILFKLLASNKYLRGFTPKRKLSICFACVYIAYFPFSNKVTCVHSSVPILPKIHIFLVVFLVGFILQQ